ncbi:hypothetical protein IC614_04560 [Allosphingosinicella flava]|uniref:Uncharacterized protein n=1 Tax=Allosphingosinicella flava TaxID=2771430 RepID=A0A7T2GLA1_9SPHN|nr:hypothetical protein [Sphingosinicella flava]QPQ55862.1 hypothetical protein IC614_04560 [Sphingosinicella flava]
MKRLFFVRTAVIGLLLTANAPVAGDEIFDTLEMVDDEELAEQRGGFVFAGMDINLGAQIRTYLDGELVLQTTVNWGATGTSNTEVMSGALTPADAAQLQAGILSTGGITMRVGDNTVYLANQGQTALMHRTDGGLQNVLINTASGVNFTQEVDANLDLGGFQQFSAGLVSERLSDSIGASIASATLNSLNN